MALDFISKLRCNKFQSHTQSNTDNLRFHVAGSKLRFGRCPQIKHKQALHLTRKLQQRTNWKVNLWLCELATALNIENWSVQVVCLADLVSLSVYLIHLADLSCWLYAYCTMYISTCKCCKVHVLQSAKKVTSHLHHILHFPLSIIHISSYILPLTHCISLSNLNLRNLWKFYIRKLLTIDKKKSFQPSIDEIS